MMVRALGIVVAGLVCIPSVSFADTAPTMLVEQTPHYTLNLSIGPVQATVSAMGAMHGMTGEVAVNGDAMMGHDAGMMSDQGMAANHYLTVHMTRRSGRTLGR